MRRFATAPSWVFLGLALACGSAADAPDSGDTNSGDAGTSTATSGNTTSESSATTSTPSTTGAATGTGGAPNTAASTTNAGNTTSDGAGASGTSSDGSSSQGGTEGSGAAANSGSTDGASTTGDSGGSGGLSSTSTSDGSTGSGGSGGSSGNFPSGPIGFASLNGGTNGGEGGEVVNVSNYADLKSYAESSTAYIIMIAGTISNGSGGGQINVNSNKSLIGVGSDALLSGVGLNISSKNNIIVRNLRMTLVGTSTPADVNGGDVISIQGTSKNIWIDHCELFSEDPATQTNIDKYDGLLDIKHQTGFITISYNYLHDHHKGGLVGSADDDLFDDRKVTYHHNYYEDVRLRIPMYRGSVGHFFNNYVVGANDATEIRAGTCVRVERNFYGPLHYSIYTPSDSPGSTELIENLDDDRTSRAYPSSCTADIPYTYSEVLIGNTADVPTLVPGLAGVGRI